jgi:predicted O-methyltransferase YrrM
MGSFPSVQVLRTPEQLGAGPAKAYGCKHASGDVYIILDSHMRMPSDWLRMIEEAVMLYPASIFCTVCRGFEMDGKFLGCGAEFARDEDLFFGRKWLGRGPVEIIDRCPCILGACYIIPAKIYKTLGGINPNFIGWGYGEQDLSIRCWMSGFEVRRINGLVVQHRFNRGLKGKFMSTWHNAYNAMVTAATIFEDDVYETLFHPFFLQVHPTRALVEFEQRRLDIEDFRETVQKLRRFSDRELSSLCGYRLPGYEEQRRRVDVILREQAKVVSVRKEKQKPDNRTYAIGLEHRTLIINNLPPGGRMLEWGSGYSTLWFRERLRIDQSLHSIEHDPQWAENIDNVELVPLEIPIGCKEAEDTSLDPHWSKYVEAPRGAYDVILIDGILRNECLRKAQLLLKRSGRVFLHDAQRDWYAEGLQGWKVVKNYDPCTDYPGPSMVELCRDI